MTNVASSVILGLGTARGLQIARFFVNRTYRLRAYWGGLLMFVILVGTLTDFVVFPATEFWALVSSIPIAAILLFLLAFVDRGVLVAMDGDIFHRDILRWRSTRMFVYASLMASVLVMGASLTLTSGSSGLAELAPLGVDQLLLVVPVVFAYGVGALVIGGRRTSDRTMKRHIKLLGFGFLCFIVAFPFFASSGLPYLFANTLIILANYFLYRAVMSLSSLGRVEKLSPPSCAAPVAIPAGTH